MPKCFFHFTTHAGETKAMVAMSVLCELPVLCELITMCNFPKAVDAQPTYSRPAGALPKCLSSYASSMKQKLPLLDSNLEVTNLKQNEHTYKAIYNIKLVSSLMLQFHFFLYQLLNKLDYKQLYLF
jgi:hypothetical protein